MAETRGRLEAAVAANGFDNVAVHPFALGPTSGDAVLHPSESSCMWSLVGEGEGVVVTQRRLDDLAEEFGPPTLIKIDAEGAEVDVIRGGESLLSRHTPLLLVEFTGSEEVGEARTLLSHYSFHRLSESHWFLRPELSSLEAPP
jgi:FkbM family methyltransferase